MDMEHCSIPWHILIGYLVYFVIGVIMLAAIFGNILVIVAILTDRKLNNVRNYLILSLAITDLSYGLTVMPIEAYFKPKVPGYWRLGSFLCQSYFTLAITGTETSMIHLFMIALDRYWSLTNIDYGWKRTKGRIGVMIAISWGIGLSIAVLNLVLQDDAFLTQISEKMQCLFSVDRIFVMTASIVGFYIPFVSIVVMYTLIYRVAKKKFQRMNRKKIAYNANTSATESSGISIETTESDRKSDESQASRRDMEGPSKMSATEVTTKDRERRVAFTLTIVTGCFVICWAPFFILLPVITLCESCANATIVPTLLDVFDWIGAINSAINPIIYTIFTLEFREAFANTIASCYRFITCRKFKSLA